MKYLITALILHLFVFASAKDISTTYLSFEGKKVRKGLAMYYQESKKGVDGKYMVKLYQMDGTLKAQAILLTKKLKVLDGHYVDYHFNGKIASEGEYLNDNQFGKWTYWYESGEKLSEGVYNQDGERDSTWFFWHKNGQIKSTGEYQDSNMVDQWISYHESGVVRNKCEYNANGELTKNDFSYYKNGAIKQSGEYESGNKVGEWKYYFETGEVSGVEQYSEGDLLSSEFWNMDGSEVDPEKANIEPEFVGGSKEMYKFIGENIKYPPKARDRNITGRVVISFVVTANGSITKVSVKQSIHPFLDQAALAIVEDMPNWVPGVDHNRKLDMTFNLPIVFRLE